MYTLCSVCAAAYLILYTVYSVYTICVVCARLLTLYLPRAARSSSAHCAARILQSSRGTRAEHCERQTVRRGDVRRRVRVEKVRVGSGEKK